MKALKNSTALVMALATMTPHYGVAQGLSASNAANASTEVQECIAAGNDSATCLEGALMLEENTEAEASETGEENAEADAQAEVSPSSETPNAETEADQSQAAAAEAQASAEAAEEAEANAEVAAEETEDAADAVAEDAADTEAAAEAATTAEADAEAEAGIAAEAEAESGMNAEAAAEAEADAAQSAEAAEDAQTAAEDSAEQAAEAAAAAEANTEAESSADADTEEAPVTTIAEDTAAETVTAPEKSAEAEAAEDMLEQSLAAEAEDGAPVAAAALAADDEGMSEETSEETITAETARSSDEDFANSVSDDTDDDKGLTTVEKAALAGLAALAVGAVLKNGSQVAANSGDRVVLEQPDGSYRVIKDDGALLRQPGTTVQTRTFDDGSSKTVSTREDGTQIVTIYDAQKRIVRRERIEPNGERYVLVDDSQGATPVEVTTLPEADINATVTATNQDALRAALQQQAQIDRTFTLSQVRQIPQVRALAPAVSVENVTFATGSSAIRPEQAEELATLGDAIRTRIAENPREVFLVEGHTDAVGNAAFNLALSDRRAETLALALTEYFNVPAENLVVQGYGEEYLKIPVQTAEEENRRASVRRITDLLRTASAE